MTLSFLDAMIYSTTDTTIGTAQDIAEMSSAFSLISIEKFFAAFIGFLAIIIILWIYLILFAWIVERKHIIAFRKFSFFKILTMGKLEAYEVTPLQMFVLIIITHLIVFLIVLGIIETFILFILEKVIEIFSKFGGMSNV